MKPKKLHLVALLLCLVLARWADGITIRHIRNSLVSEEDNNWEYAHLSRQVSGGRGCNVTAECNHGECTNGSCACQEGYSASDCSYELKSKTQAFTLSFLIGNWGADCFYLGFVGLGLLKLFGCLFFCCLPCLPLCFVCCTVDEARMKICYFATLLTLISSISIIWIWWLVDWLAIVGNDFQDSSGYPLHDDM